MKTPQIITLCIVLLLAAPPAGSVQIYTWIDDNGVTHFSESPPGDNSLAVEQLEVLPPPSAGSTTDENFYSVVNQANRMETRRLENMKIIAERQQAEAETKRAAAEAQAIKQSPYQDNNNARYYPAYPVIPRYGYGRPGYGRPGYRPGYGRPGYKYPAHHPAYRQAHTRHRTPSVSLGRVTR
ncbi:MAG: DUF4124 domain-containing protein [Gammaproteobacteria bacterium]|nr:DUF4124 domain-containing protein [Gammaproteobacteria bacterium]